VQYAHARIAAILRYAAERGLLPADGPDTPLGAPAETALVRKLSTFPEVVRGAAVMREPHRIPTYLMETAAEFHRYYHVCRVVGDDVALQVVSGNGWDQALDAAEWQDGEVLALGTSPRGDITRVFLGSRGTKIMRHSPVPVLVLPG